MAASGESAVTAAQVGLVLVDLHAKLMLPDADVRDLHAALGADDGCSWSIVDAANGSLRVAGPTPDDRLSVMVRRRPAGTARWKPFLRGLGVPLNAVTDTETESVLVVGRPAAARYGLVALSAEADPEEEK